MTKSRFPAITSRLLSGSEGGAIWLVAIIGLGLSFAALLLIRQQL